MVSLNKSFIWGIIFASITWIISLYLYWQLSLSNANMVTSTQFISPSEFMNHAPKAVNHNIMGNEIPENNVRKKWNDWKDKMNNKKAFFKKYHNSDNLIKSLQPVYPKDETLEDPGLSIISFIFIFNFKRTIFIY